MNKINLDSSTGRKDLVLQKEIYRLWEQCSKETKTNILCHLIGCIANNDVSEINNPFDGIGPLGTPTPYDNDASEINNPFDGIKSIGTLNSYDKRAYDKREGGK